MLMKSQESLLLIVDVQAKLVRAIHESQRLVEHCAWLVKVARELNVPLRLSEQYPQGLGPTVAPLRELAADDEVLDKVHFSCVAEERCREALLETGREQLVVAGVEAHVCVLQTVLDWAALAKPVFVVADAVSSRDPRNAELGLARMRQAGAHIVSREMVAFEWAHKAGTDRFRNLSRNFLR